MHLSNDKEDANTGDDMNAQQRKEIQTPAMQQSPMQAQGEDVENWSQNQDLKTRQFHMHRGNHARGFLRVKTRTGDDQPIKEVDYDDSHSAISIGVKKSAIKKPVRKIMIIVKL